ncbi:MAG: transposase, partial [bacterium]|nr:transposase [bacterium]
DKNAFSIIREHQQVPFRPLDAMREVGTTETGTVSEQNIEIEVESEDGKLVRLPLRRIRLGLKKPTRDGETVIYILTDLPEEVADAVTVAELYRKRWTIETAFQRLEKDLHSEINTLAYPKAALFGFCIALVAYNILAVVRASLGAVHGTEKIDREFSPYHLAHEIAATYQGMMIAIPPEEWAIFRALSVAQMGELLRQMATKVRLSAFRKQTRGLKKPVSRRR